MKAQYVESGDARLFAEVSGGGPPIVLLHGWPLDRRTFALQAPALSRYFTVISFDRRGFGKSQGSPDMRLELDDIDRILDSFADSPAHLLGMSQGARIALRYAITRPERLRSLILQGAVVDGLPVPECAEERTPIAEYAELARQNRLDEFRRLWLRHPMMTIGAEHGEALSLINSMLEDYRGADLRDYAPEMYAFPVDVVGALPRIMLPTLILTGANETEARKAHARTLVRLMPDAREIILPKSGHLSNLTEAAIYNQAVIDFCLRVDTRRNQSGRRALD